MNPDKNFVGKIYLLLIVTAIILVAVSFIAPFDIGEMSFKRSNIFSDLYTFESDTTFHGDLVIAEAKVDSLFLEEAQKLENLDTLAIDSAITLNRKLDGSSKERIPTGADPIVTEGCVPLVDYSMDDRLGQIQAKLNRGEKLRIAVLGDSFIESDILTCDLREKLQDVYGGSGVGYIPFSSPITVRPTVKHTHKGWTNYNLINKKKAPEQLDDKFPVSGYISIPEEGATVKYEGTKYRKHLAKFYKASLLFINEGNTNIFVTVNDTINYQFKPQSSGAVQHIDITGEISKIEMRFTDVEGFLGYGMELESSKGVTVDNLSLRSNSGLPLMGSSYSINSQFNQIFGYDMIILQYGLNVMSKELYNYGFYVSQFLKVIDYMKLCFPDAAIVVMGVGDRCFNIGDDTPEDNRAVLAMVNSQRTMAERGEVLFWDTYRAMSELGGMRNFVKNGWAAKDYTHIGYQGGKRLAAKMAGAIAAVEGGEQAQAYELPPAPDTTDIDPVDSVAIEEVETPVVADTLVADTVAADTL